MLCAVKGSWSAGFAMPMPARREASALASIHSLSAAKESLEKARSLNAILREVRQSLARMPKGSAQHQRRYGEEASYLTLPNEPASAHIPDPKPFQQLSTG